MDQRERFEWLFKGLPNGKIQLWDKQLEAEGAGPFPVFHGESALRERDPAGGPSLIFTDEHSAFINHHAWMRDVPWLREIQPHPTVKIHPMTAARYGIGDGDWVEIVSSRGRMKAVARLFEGIRPDTLMGQHGWWQGCPALGLQEVSPFDGGTNPNVLYDWECRDPFSGDISKNTLVTIRKGTPPDAADFSFGGER
jgi:anaerobic selenocysteine-containing dehydrogenase